MKTIIGLLLVISMVTACTSTTQKTVVSASENGVALKVAELVSAMTLEEKVGQMTQVTFDVLITGQNPKSSDEPVVIDTAMLYKAFKKYQIGSVLNTPNNRARTPEEWNRIVGLIQEYALKYSRLKIPMLYGLDMIHGASYVAGATLFPQQIGMAATWNPELLKVAGEITAYETRACGVSWTFSPVLDLGLDPRWPRQWETFGEDPYLVSEMGTQLIKGYEGSENQIGDKTHVAACLKHFLGYSQPLSGKDRTPAWIPENMLREYHVPSFAAGVNAGAHSLMINSGEINGTPVHANKLLLTDLLKTELKFEGFAVSDWQDIEYLYLRHHVAESQKDAVALAINAGVDMSMVPYNFDFADYLVELVKEGKVPMSRIDDAVSRILRVKIQLGLFETPMTNYKDYPDFGSEKFAESALNTAIESITLLKNEQSILPLSRKSRILVTGPAANKMRPMTGGWSYSWQGDLADEFAAEFQTIYEAIQANASGPENVKLCEGVRYGTGDYRNEIVDDPGIFSKMAAQSDVIVMCLGENSYTETPGNLTDLSISQNQQELVKLAVKSGKPIVFVLVEGRPRIISMIEPFAKAIVQAYLPGNFGGVAIAKILFGDANPSGRLPYTYPRFVNSLEPYYHKATEEIETSGAPAGTTFDPQYEFGFGLSYSDFIYSDLRIDKTSYKSSENIHCSLTISNKSNVAGKEVVQIFISDHYASITPPVKRLRDFEKVLLQPGESKRVSFEIPVNQLAFINASNQLIVEKGSFTLQTGALSTDFMVEETKVY